MEEMINYTSCPGCGSRDISYIFAAKDNTVSGEAFEIWECKDCTLRFTQNIPEQENIGRYYQSEKYISHSDTTEGLVNKLYHLVRKRTLLKKRKLVETTTKTMHGSIIDLGAGTGAFLNTMKLAGWHTEGLEPDITARKKASELYGLNLKESSELFSLPDDNFDAITLWHVLEHAHQLHEYVIKFRQLLKKKGKLFIAVPNFTSKDAAIYKKDWAAYDVPRHLYHFSPKSMEVLLNTHGFSLEKIQPMWYDSVYVSMLSEKYKTGKPNNLKALINGVASNVSAFFDSSKCSSLIYIASPK
jgi:2-polyprenyl-3-methyl-5-hydroxy-6-metoxy-1,4-benzoquinol methylase